MERSQRHATHVGHNSKLKGRHIQMCVIFLDPFENIVQIFKLKEWRRKTSTNVCNLGRLRLPQTTQSGDGKLPDKERARESNDKIH